MSEYTTRQILDMIEANGGPGGLDLRGKDLSEIDLSPTAIEAELAKLRKKNPRAIPKWFEEVEIGISGGRVNLREADLSFANLQEASLYGVNLDGASLIGTQLYRADLSFADLQWAHLAEANLEGASLHGANLKGVGLFMANLKEADLYRANLEKAYLEGVDLRQVDLRGVESLEGACFYHARLDRTEMNRSSLGPAIGEELSGRYDSARDVYLSLKQNFDDLGDYAASAWAYQKERQMEKACSAPWRARSFYGKEQLGDTSRYKPSAYHPRVWWFFVRHTAKWLSDWLVELVCGYAERPWRTVATMALVFGVFIGIYWGTWAVMRVEHRRDGTWLIPTRNLIDLAVFGLGAFTTMDPKGLDPQTSWVQFAAGFEALLGIFLTGLLGFVAGNRIRRS